jgi:hypothetical protein
VTGAAGRADRLPLVALAALTAVCAAMYAHVFAGEPAGDDNTFHLAEIVRLAECLAAGDLDAWNPSANLGFASGYYYQVVPQLVPAAAAALTGSAALFWFQLGIVVPLVLAPAAAYRATRRLGEPGWNALGAAFALAFCVSGSKWGHASDGTFSVGLYTQTWALAALPLALAAGIRWLATGRGLGGAVAWGVFVGLCHPLAGVALGIALVAGELARAAASAIGRRSEPRRSTAMARLAVLGALLIAGSASAWLPVVVDYDGFGGFPHRVAGEAGPGVTALAGHLARGWVLDFARLPVLTWLAPAALLLHPTPWRARLWGAALAFAALLAAGPHLVTPDDLVPAVRFFGALQVVAAMAIGAGVVGAARHLWRYATALPRRAGLGRAAIAAALTALALLVAIPGALTIAARVRISDDYPDLHVDQLDALLPAIRAAPPGRQQARGGADVHWLNLLPYVRTGRPALLQMGGGALQSSPNYVFLWEMRSTDHIATAAHVFDAPLVLVRRAADDDVDGTVIAATADLQLEVLPSPGLVSPVHVTGALPRGRRAARTAALDWLASDRPMAGDVLAYDGGPGPAPRGRVVASARRAPGDGPDIIATVEAEAPTTFVLRESWHPRWRATLDGRAVAIRRVTPDVIAIDVPPGRHELAWTFARPWWALAAWLLWPAAAALGTIVRRHRELD